MEKEERKGFVAYCKEYILDHIENWEDSTHYGCDWGDYLTEGPNVDGSVTYSTYEAKQYLKEWWDECGSYWQYEKDNFGQNLHNPFDEPEAFMVCMLIEGVRAILSKIDVIDENWNNNLTMDAETIEKIKEGVNEVSDYEDLF